MHTLATLLDGVVEAPISAAAAARPVTGVFDDSRRVEPGGVFVAVRGGSVDGREFIAEAVARGAVAVVGEDVEPVDGAEAVRVRDARAALARLACRWHGVDRLCREGLTLLAVTGTNGKSTTAYMARAILSGAGKRCGMIGTVQYDLCGRTVKAGNTTPGPLELAGCLRECADNGAAAVVMEVSSHGLDQRRTHGLRFAAAAFTNLTRDHLDYHGTFEAYADAKARLFDALEPSATAVVNVDDPHHERMTRDCRARLTTYALDRPADLTARVLRDTIGGTLYRMRLGDGDVVLENALIGRHNVYNALAAAGLALAAGVDPRAIERGLADVRTVPGRLQRVPCTPGVEVFVDYAHTPDALANVLRVLRGLAERRLIVVFGCGGERDRPKRPMMARAAAEFADPIFVTSDNPRHEDPDAIIAEILTGFSSDQAPRVHREPDRRRAISAALAAAQPGDVVLIAGKGHEDYQIVGPQRRRFDDVEVAIEAASKLQRAAAAEAPGS